MTNLTAFQQGKSAGYRGHAIDTCPYQAGYEDWCDWMGGHRAGELLADIDRSEKYKAAAKPFVDQMADWSKK